MFRCATASGWENVTYDGNLKSYADSRIADQRRDYSAVSPLPRLRRKRGTFSAVTCWCSEILPRSAGGSPCQQERKAEHIEQSYEHRGVPEKEAERRAWATVNKDDGGGKRAGGSGRGKSTGHPAAHKGGRIGGAAAAARSPASRSAAAKKAAATRKRNSAGAAKSRGS
jgi:hypothetical protein